MSCPKFPYGRFNYTTTNLKLFPNQQSIIELKNVKNTVTFDEVKNIFDTYGTILNIYSKDDGNLKLIYIKFKRSIDAQRVVNAYGLSSNDPAHLNLDSLKDTNQNPILDVDLSFFNTKNIPVDEPYVFVPDNCGLFSQNGVRGTFTGNLGTKTFVQSGNGLMVEPSKRIVRDVNQPMKKSVFPNTHKLTKAQIYSLLSNNRLNR